MYKMADKPVTPKSKSSPGDRWTIRGVPHETRSAASVSAKKAGLSLGDWGSDAVMEKALSGRQLPATQTDMQPIEDIRQRLESLEGQGTQPIPSRKKVLRLFGLPVASYGEE